MWECLVAANFEGLYQKLRFFVAGLFVYVFFFFIRFLSCQTDSEIVVLAVKMESLGFLFSFFIKKMLKDTKMKGSSNLLIFVLLYTITYFKYC